MQLSWGVLVQDHFHTSSNNFVMPTTIQDYFNPRHHCKGLPEEVKWFDCRESKHSLLPNEPCKWGGYPSYNYSSEDHENKQQSFNGWEPVSKAKQTCHNVKESSPSSCTKDFPKATVTLTAPGTHEERCRKMSMPIETNFFWEKKKNNNQQPPYGTFSYVFLYLSCSLVSLYLSTSLTCCPLKNETYKQKNYVIHLAHRGWQHYYLFHFSSRKKESLQHCSIKVSYFLQIFSPPQKLQVIITTTSKMLGNKWHTGLYSQPNKVTLPAC